jgi:hypothetical protein
VVLQTRLEALLELLGEVRQNSDRKLGTFIDLYQDSVRLLPELQVVLERVSARGLLMLVMEWRTVSAM